MERKIETAELKWRNITQEDMMYGQKKQNMEEQGERKCDAPTSNKEKA